jgi:Uma2 family endonuclease
MALALKKTQTRAPWGEYVGIGPLTVEEFSKLPFEDGWQFELHQGRLIRTAWPDDAQGNITANFYDTVQPFLRSKQLGKLWGPTRYELPLTNNHDDVCCPDLSYLSPARLPLTKHGSAFFGPPDLAIEITSANDFWPQMQAKAQIYLQAEIRLAWIVWPNRQIIDVWRSSKLDAPTEVLQVTDTLDGLDVIPGFTCPVNAIFAEN